MILTGKPILLARALKLALSSPRHFGSLVNVCNSLND